MPIIENYCNFCDEDLPSERYVEQLVTRTELYICSTCRDVEILKGDMSVCDNCGGLYCGQGLRTNYYPRTVVDPECYDLVCSQSCKWEMEKM